MFRQLVVLVGVLCVVGAVSPATGTPAGLVNQARTSGVVVREGSVVVAELTAQQAAAVGPTIDIG